MASGPNRTPTPPLGSIVLILLFAAGVYVQQFQLQSARPDAPDTKRNRFVVVQDVKARLWQDPLEAVMRHREAAGTPASVVLQSDNLHDAAVVKRLLADKGDNAKVVILAAMAFGGPYADDMEQRRRQRYAILSGLAMQGYEPDDPDNIGFFFAPAVGGAAPDAVAFEWLQLENKDKDPKKNKGILLLWLEEESYAASEVEPLAKLRTVIDSLDGDPKGLTRKLEEKIPLVVLGPASSAGLDRLGRELTREENKPPQCPSKPVSSEGLDLLAPGVTKEGKPLRDPSGIVCRLIEIYSATATTTEWYIPGLRGVTVRNLLRTTSTDEQLALAIRKELALRGAEDVCEKPGSYVVLVSESDTDYGKQLPYQMQSALGCTEGAPAIIRKSYLRGLDGKTSGTPAKGEKSESRPDDGKTHLEKGNAERADGNSQSDYVRRLADDLRDLDERLHKDGKGRIRAVGVLGSDFYDKLILLQALRPELRQAVFFTTDLDARYLSSEQYRWTRNLIVASSFGLELAPGLQGLTPPFRDTYQTSTFLATRLAFEPALEGRIERKQQLLDQWLAHPRVFEIGRTGAFDLTREVPGTPALPAHCSETRGLEECSNAHLQRPALRLTPCERGLLVFAILTFVAALAAYSRHVRKIVGNRRTALVLCVILLVMVFGFGFLVQFLTLGGADEPFAWLEGISIWPTVFIRVLAAFLCLWFIRYAVRNFKRTRRKLVLEFRLPRIRASRSGAGSTRRWGWLRELLDAYHWPPLQSGKLAPVDVVQLWEQYRERASWRRRLRRVAPVAVLFFVFSLTAVLLLGPPPVPYRGDLSRWAEIVSLFLVAAPLAVLLFLVVDATMLCRTFIFHLQERSSAWPSSTIAQFEQETGISDRLVRARGSWTSILNDWIDVRYIASYTQEVSGLIWYPFIVIALLVAAHNSLFDHWQLSAGMALILVASVGYAVACAVILQFTAAKAREIALSNMRDKLVWARGNEPALAGQIDTLMGAITNLRQGAFRPITEQPLVRAVLVTLSSYGGLSIAEYLALLPR